FNRMTTRRGDELKHLPKFNGHPRKWHMWKQKFLTRAESLGYYDILIGDVVLPGPTDPVDAAIIEANTMAFQALMYACQGPAFGLVDTSRTDLAPRGDAALAWEKLTQKYGPTDTIRLLELRDEYISTRLQDFDDVDEWYIQIDTILQEMARHKQTYNSVEQIAHLLAGLPDEADSLEQSLRINLSYYDVEEVRRIIREYYRSRERKLRLSGDETALFAGKQFKGKCRKCGKYGHKSSDCRSKIKKGSTGDDDDDDDSGDDSDDSKEYGPRIKGNCTWCGKPGHMEKYCFSKKAGKPQVKSGKSETKKKKKGSSKKHSKKKKGKEKAHVIDTGEDSDEDDDEDEEDEVSHSSESAMIAYCLHSPDQKIRCKKNTWIIDSGATSHMV
ncbi:MAG: hypothetical protein AAF587_44925, partial [Bacteroidota bacterium]